MSNEKVAAITPPNLGWLEYKLDTQEMDYVWRCIENKKEDAKHMLAGNITGSYSLLDRGDWFWNKTLKPLCHQYFESSGGWRNSIGITQKHPYYMNRWWVNYQRQNEVNPKHDHMGIYSFVIFMKIPISFKEQNKLPISAKSNRPVASAFEFFYTNILGELYEYKYQLEPENEGQMLFFPSKLNHMVYQFYNCDEERITVSGNITLNTTKRA